jgi:8-oxo-dGTP pyrophosphatase MutT (NUDIX family)
MPLARFVAFHEISELDAASVSPTYAVMMAHSHKGVVLVLSRFRRVWELPGGAIDPGESPRQAAIRELVEESGCVARETRWIGIVEVNDGQPRFGALLYCEVDQVPEDFSNAETVAIDYWRTAGPPAPLGEPDEAVLRKFAPIFDAEARGTMRPMQVTLNALATFPAELEKHYAAFPPGYVNWSPPSWDGVPSEAFTAIEQICHVRDIEIEGYQVRFRRTLDQDMPELPSIDSEALAKQRDYARSDTRQVFAEIHEARAQTLALLRGLDAAQLQRPAVFEGYGRVTMRGLVHYLCSHDQQHLSGLQWLLGKIDAARA